MCWCSGQEKIGVGKKGNTGTRAHLLQQSDGQECPAYPKTVRGVTTNRDFHERHARQTPRDPGYNDPALPRPHGRRGSKDRPLDGACQTGGGRTTSPSITGGSATFDQLARFTMEVFAIFAVVLGIAVVFRLLAGSMDGDRVVEYIRNQGGEVIESHWSPFGPRLVRRKRTIEFTKYVTEDRHGNIHDATVKTSMFSGVYFTEDRIVEVCRCRHRMAKRTRTRNLTSRPENARLRRRVAELENKDRR